MRRALQSMQEPATASGIEQRLRGYGEQMRPHAERQAITGVGTMWIIAGAMRAVGKRRGQRPATFRQWARSAANVQRMDARAQVASHPRVSRVGAREISSETISRCRDRRKVDHRRDQILATTAAVLPPNNP